MWGQLLEQVLNRLAKLGENMREITNKNAPFLWGPEYTQDFIGMKQELTSSVTLRYYN